MTESFDNDSDAELKKARKTTMNEMYSSVSPAQKENEIYKMKQSLVLKQKKIRDKAESHIDLYH